MAVEVLLDMESRINDSNGPTISAEENKKSTEKNIKRVLIQYIKKEINEIPSDTYNGFEFLVDLDFSASQIKILPNDLFKQATLINSLNFSNNQLKTLPNNLLGDLKNLTVINFSENNIKQIPNDLFRNNTKLTSINFSGNSIKEIPIDLIKNIEALNSIDFSLNELKSIPGNLFVNSDSLYAINFSNNKIKEITQESLAKLVQLRSIDISYNELKDIPIDLFDNSPKLKTIDFSNNKIKDLSADLFNELKHLQYVDFSVNRIVNLSKYIFMERSFLGDFRNNIDTNDLSDLFNLLFDNYTKFAISAQLFSNYYVFRDLQQEGGFTRFVETKNKFDNTIFLCRKINSKVLSANLLSLFLNKTCYHSSMVTGDVSQDTNIDYLQTYEYKKKRIESFEWSILDFFIFLSDLTSDVIIYFKSLIESSLAQNPSLINLEFKFRTTDVIAEICRRDDFLLFEAFFPPSAFKDYIHNIDEFNDFNATELDHKIFKFIDNSDFYLNIDYCLCFELALKNENEKIALHLLLILKYVMLSNLSEPTSDLNQARFKNILDFNKKLVKEYMVKLFEFEWWELIEFVLDHSRDGKYLYLLEEQLFNKTTKKNKVSPFEKGQEAPDENNEHSILMLIAKSKRPNLLKHETTVELLETKWKYVPRILYYSHLSVFLVFLVFYSINIEIYKNSYSVLQDVSKYISLAFLFYFFLLEIIEFLDSVISVNIFQYMFSYRNLIFLVNFPMCVATLFLKPGDAKSALYTVSILLSYCMFIQKLDKFYGIGTYVSVFGDVIRKSSKLLIIIVISLIGFLLAFRNRANYSSVDSYNIPYFNVSFELSFMQMATMVIGNDGTDNMGIANIVPENMINFILYLTFLFMVPILFINIFTGIAINAIEELIENSEANIIMNKIEYVFRWESIIKKSNHKWFYFLIQNLLKIILGMKKFIVFFEQMFNDNTEKVSQRAGYFKRAYENYKKNNLGKSKESNKNQIEELDKKLNNVLFELSKMAILNQNKFEYLENKIEANNHDNKIDELFAKIEEVNKKIKI